MRNFIPGNSYNIVYLNLSRYLSFREITVISTENNADKTKIYNPIRGKKVISFAKIM